MAIDSLQNYLETLRKDTSGLSAGGRKIAFFDLDGTLIAAYSIVALAWETARHGAARGELKDSLKILRAMLRQRTSASGSSYHRLVRRLSHSLSGISETTLRELGEGAYQRHLARSLYSEAIALIEAHRALGHHLVIVSAASYYQVAPIARVLGIDDIRCTRLEVVDGIFSGKVLAPMCYGEGKSLAARRVAREQQSSLSSCWFYSDSSADLPLLREVGHPVAVNPSDKLDVQARLHNWPRLRFSSRGRPSLESLLRTSLTAQAVAATTALGVLGARLGTGQIDNSNRMTRMLGDLGSGLAGLDFEIDGDEHLHSQRPAIFIFNHQSLLDAMVLAHLLREDVVAFCKREVAANPLLGPLLKRAGTIFVEREQQDQSRVLREALQVLHDGRSLVIAPEGTRSTLGNIQSFKHGAFFLARKAGVPIIPIVLHNVRDALPKGAILLRPTTIRVSVLPPQDARQMGGVRQACRHIENNYREVLGQSPSATLGSRAAN